MLSNSFMELCTFFFNTFSDCELHPLQVNLLFFKIAGHMSREVINLCYNFAICNSCLALSSFISTLNCATSSIALVSSCLIPQLQQWPDRSSRWKLWTASTSGLHTKGICKTFHITKIININAHHAIFVKTLLLAHP